MPHRRYRRHRGGLPPIFLLPIILIVGLILLVVAFGGVVSLIGGAAVAGLICLAPFLVVGLVVWAILQNQRKGAAGSTPARPAADQAPTEAGSVAATSAATPVAQSAAAARPRAADVMPAPIPNPYPERGAPAPGAYKQRAAAYRKRIQSLVKGRRSGPIADRLAAVSARLTSWEERVGQLADRLAFFEKDDVIRRDFKEVPQRIARLRVQVAAEVDPEMRNQVARTLAAYEQHYSQLDALARVMRRTRLNLDDTLAAMGTIYSQVQVLNAMDIDSARAARISDEIDVEVTRLGDLLSALGEAYDQSEASEARRERAEEDADALTARKSRLGSGRDDRASR